MESTILIQATRSEMNQFFDRNQVCLVKYYSLKKAGFYKAIIRHAELKKPLCGVYTIPQLNCILQAADNG